MTQGVCGRIQIQMRLMTSLKCHADVRHKIKRLKIWSWKGDSSAVIRPTVTYGCETWNLHVRAQKSLLVFENKALRRISGPKKDPIMGRFEGLPSSFCGRDM